ncbi:hypothetical protein F2Q68_00032087 [Brassica cretica]|uniref:Uncharacterized protein n=1 Tax=Brassica cretica TaxID=69181 RepID=A0A8S9GH60_BRACR|nr:hypothetical protein F2Q68_00032087 [Brassica cretica]
MLRLDPDSRLSSSVRHQYRSPPTIRSIGSLQYQITPRLGSPESVLSIRSGLIRSEHRTQQIRCLQARDHCISILTTAGSSMRRDPSVNVYLTRLRPPRNTPSLGSRIVRSESERSFPAISDSLHQFSPLSLYSILSPNRVEQRSPPF